jgi:AcrR family transcriptional regulator
MAKEALDKIDGRKRERIFGAAAAEFARHGYHKANVNSIAQRASIGKGSIYLYFTDKRDLYYSTFKEAVRLQDRIFDEIERTAHDPVEKIKRVFRESLITFPRYRNMYKMYFELSASGDAKFLADLAQLLERRSADFFIRVLREGIESGSLREDLPVEHAAYVMDSIYTLFLATLASRYQRERFRVFTNSEITSNGEMIERHMDVILNVLETGITSCQGTRGSGSRQSPERWNTRRVGRNKGGST